MIQHCAWALGLLLFTLMGPPVFSTPVDPPERFTEHRNARDGRLLFLRNDAAQVTQAARRTASQRTATLPVSKRDELKSPAWSNEVATARQFLARHGRAFVEGNRLTARATAVVADPDLNLLSAERDHLGMTHVRFQQTHHGLPVFGTELTVHLAADGRVCGAGGSVAAELAVDPTPVFTRDQADTLAVAMWQYRSGSQETPQVRNTRLCVLAPGLLHNDGDPTAWLVWEVRLLLEQKDCLSNCDALADETFYLDAHTGDLRERMTGFRSLDRRVYDCAKWPGETIACQIDSIHWVYMYYFGRSEGQLARGPCPQEGMGGIFLGSLDTDHLYDYLGLVHNYYLTNFNRDGGNGRGGIGNGTDLPWTMTKGSAHTQGHPVYANGCPTGNGTCWNRNGSIRFCLGMVVPGVVGHEYAHSIPFLSHYDNEGKPVGMAYEGTRETGALQESYSDFFGEVMKCLVTGTNDWLVGANSASGVIRCVSDPPSIFDGLYGEGAYPDRYGAPNFYCDTNRVYGLYHNTGIPSKAAYLLSAGGLFNGCSVAPIGMAPVSQIWYRAMTQYYTTTETFNGAYVGLVQSAVDLYGPDSEEVRQVTRALQAVEMDQASPCSGLPARVPHALVTEGW